MIRREREREILSLYISRAFVQYHKGINFYFYFNLGLRSYGKVIYVFTLVPVFGTLILCTKLLGLIPPGSIHQFFPATVWSEFFINGKSWVAASNEVFLTWGLLGAAAMQVLPVYNRTMII